MKNESNKREVKRRIETNKWEENKQTKFNKTKKESARDRKKERAREREREEREERQRQEKKKKRRKTAKKTEEERNWFYLFSEIAEERKEDQERIHRHGGVTIKSMCCVRVSERKTQELEWAEVVLYFWDKNKQSKPKQASKSFSSKENKSEKHKIEIQVKWCYPVTRARKVREESQRGRAEAEVAVVGLQFRRKTPCILKIKRQRVL